RCWQTCPGSALSFTTRSNFSTLETEISSEVDHIGLYCSVDPPPRAREWRRPAGAASNELISVCLEQISLITPRTVRETTHSERERSGRGFDEPCVRLE